MNYKSQLNKHKLEIAGILASLIVLALGFILGFKNADIFARSGSIVVAISLVITFVGAKSKISEAVLTLMLDYLTHREEQKLKQERLLKDRAQFDQRVYNMDISSNHYDERLSLESNLNENAKKSLVKEFSSHLKFSMIVEFVLLITGTLVWGFGDIIYDLMH